MIFANRGGAITLGVKRAHATQLEVQGIHMRIGLACSLLVMLTLPAAAQTVSSERDIGALRLGQKILVDDGSCPTGQIKEVSGARLVEGGNVEATRQCVPAKVRR